MKLGTLSLVWNVIPNYFYQISKDPRVPEQRIIDRGFCSAIRWNVKLAFKQLSFRAKTLEDFGPMHM